MTKIVYILGAGASSKALPVVKEMPLFLKAYVDNFSGHEDTKIQMIKMIEESTLYPSPDVYARALLLKGDKRFDWFNSMLSLAFYWKQTYDNLYEHNQKREKIGEKFKYSVDPRYLGFFSSLVDKPKGVLPPDLGFILWNYDSQIEASLSMLHIDNPPPIVWLNGKAIVEKDGEIIDSRADFEKHKNDLSGLKSKIRYGWHDQEENDAELEKILSDTVRIVLIGYSFPVYNRITDSKIFKIFRNDFKTKAHLEIDIAGHSEDSLNKSESSISQILNEWQWKHEGKDLRPRINKVLSPDQFHIPYGLPIFGRTSK